ncbi:uncharacterized protein LAESUDRAFT_78697 [Laetiporus sulphureus 93-53]|uniref:Uncharacterized protein n=1 Tax=Laetiporus sulphureus 93-53 TaxID=1314785 RepID=A0A165F1A4_9APHY|nr:uncharacterized protein LAESUDRAFT_78697 [Laetiporus sulphureus 93-53]KZT08159.1 hypothetical protein LAESUDRAFT_78697 [Laetiporus sulphureus 93-53]
MLLEFVVSSPLWQPCKGMLKWTTKILPSSLPLFHVPKVLHEVLGYASSSLAQSPTSYTFRATKQQFQFPHTTIAIVKLRHPSSPSRLHLFQTAIRRNLPTRSQHRAGDLGRNSATDTYPAISSSSR